MYFITNTIKPLAVILAFSCVCRWDHHSTTGEPPLGVANYGCCSIGHNIFYFAGHCNHPHCRHNSLNVLSVDDFTWKELLPTSDATGPMRKSGCGMLAFHNWLLAVGGGGESLPKDPSPSATYKKDGDIIYTNEHHIYDREGG